MQTIDLTGVKGIIFDYGGTLDTGGDHWSEVIWRAYGAAGVAVDKALFREAYVYAERELARTLHILPHHDFHDLLLIKMRLELQWLAGGGHFPPDMVEQKAAELARLCDDSARQSVERARPTLEALHSRFPMVLVSNFYGNIHTVLAGFGIDRCFDKVIESAVVGVRKPDPKIFMLGVEALGLKPGEVLVIGDSYRKDIEPARSIGCKALWLKGIGWTADEDARRDPGEIAELDEVLGLLAGA